MTGIGKVLSLLTRKRKIVEPEVKILLRKNESVFATQFFAPNTDSRPLPGDVPLFHRLEQIGKKAVIGFIDPKNETAVNGGEYKVYSRDSGGGIVSFIHLKNDGSISISVSGNVFELSSDGNLTAPANVDISGDLIVGGEITCTDAVIGGIRFSTHRHGGVETGTGTSGPPVP